MYTLKRATKRRMADFAALLANTYSLISPGIRPISSTIRFIKTELERTKILWVTSTKVNLYK